MLREKPERINPKGESTNEWHEGGETRSSDEVFVMKMERRGFPFGQVQIDN
jgi:hypothetical protein